MSEPQLAVIRDGVDLPEAQARALWRAFSEHMERNRGDAAGFARGHGFASVRAEHRRGRAILWVFSKASLPPPARTRARRATTGASASKGVPPRVGVSVTVSASSTPSKKVAARRR